MTLLVRERKKEREPVARIERTPGARGRAGRQTSTLSYLFRNLLLFGRVLRQLGLDVQAGRMLDVAQALEYVDIGRERDFYHALRTLLVHRQ